MAPSAGPSTGASYAKPLGEQCEGFRFAQHLWRERALARFPLTVQRLALERAAELDPTDYVGANRLTARLAGNLTRAHLVRAFDEEWLRSTAERYARTAEGLADLGNREGFARYLAIPPPGGRLMTAAGRAARLADVLWWRRALRRHWTRAAENAMREMGCLRRGRDPYASETAVRHRGSQKRRWRDFLEASRLVAPTGESLDLLSVAEHSLSNPAIRRAEFMMRVRGFEQIAGDLGHVAEFVTLTAPSAFHAELASGGANPAYTGATVRAAQEWLSKMWARARAKLKRREILTYGFRIAEPHHDGTPHWHLLLFLARTELDSLRAVITDSWLSDFADEPGARSFRTRFETIDPAKGSAVGYLAKYVAKNIDAHGAIGDATDLETGRTIKSDLKRVDAWASIHGIRQFQQLGGPPVGLWREARRLRSEVPDVDLERARRCADRGDWRAFVQAVGGIRAGHRTSIRLERVEDGTKSRYGEPRAARVIGLRCCSSVAITRPYRWRMVRKPCFRAEKNTRSRPASSRSPYSYCHGSKVRGEGERTDGDPAGWTNPNETSQAGPA